MEEVTESLPEAKSSKPKPQWLAKLEEESWQAELLVSGAAIVGAFQLPGLISRLDDYVLYTINREAMLFWYFLSVFLSLFAIAIIGTFLLHFVLRTLWIAMIGFNSVYPQGFQPSERYSEDYQQKLYKEFGDISGYIQRLDQTCSSILAIGFSVVFTALGWGLVLAILGLLFYWTRDYLPSSMGFWLGVFLYALVILLAGLSMMMSSKKYRERDWVKKYHFPLTTAMGKGMYNLGYRPTNIVINLLYSRSEEKSQLSFFFKVILVSVGIGILLPNLNDNITYYLDDVYHRSAADSTSLFASAYADELGDGQVYRPVLPSLETSDARLLRVFIPLPNREYFEMMKQCSQPEVDKDLSRQESRIAQRQRTINCGKEYIQLFLNGQEIQDFELLRQEFGRRKQYGLEVIVLRPPYQEGKNMLKIVTQYLNEEGQPKEAYAPIYFLPQG